MAKENEDEGCGVMMKSKNKSNEMTSKARKKKRKRKATKQTSRGLMKTKTKYGRKKSAWRVRKKPNDTNGYNIDDVSSFLLHVCMRRQNEGEKRRAR